MHEIERPHLIESLHWFQRLCGPVYLAPLRAAEKVEAYITVDPAYGSKADHPQAADGNTSKKPLRGLSPTTPFSAVMTAASRSAQSIVGR